MSFRSATLRPTTTTTPLRAPLHVSRLRAAAACGLLAGALALGAASPAGAAGDPRGQGGSTTSADQSAPKVGTEGQVVARGGLLLRDAPTRDSAVIRHVPYGATVRIYCRTSGDTVDQDTTWYLLTDGTWAWGSARYVKTVGAAPRWC
ncbi:SH3 domain-containing protein [Streptomyces sp. NPDC007088]|uniref:SH3 domain-containing protein n=1 Tax=Streptomyces sp. NPDC007088 TaxID=3364773 RepID=UPI00367841A5